MTYAGLTTADKGALLDAKARGAEWVARDLSTTLWGYDTKPHKCKFMGEYETWTIDDENFVLGAIDIDDDVLQFIQWSDAEPVNIDLALAQIAGAVSERLTLENSYGEDGKSCEDCEFFGEPNGCNREDGACDAYTNHQDLYQRLFDIESILYDADGNEVISLEELAQLLQDKREGRVVVLPVKQALQAYRLRELAEAEQMGRLVIRPDCAVCKLRIATEGHPNCGYEQSCSGKKRASFFEPLAATEPKGDAT